MATPRPVSPIPIATTGDLDSCLNAYLSSKSRKPPPSVKSRLLPHIAARRIAAAEAKDYKTALRLSQAEQELRSYFQSMMHHDRAVRAVQTPATPSTGLTERLQSAAHRFDRDIADFVRTREEFMQQLRLAH
jgi:hypothetical protein